MLRITTGVPAPVLCTGLKHPSTSAPGVIRGCNVLRYAPDASGDC